MPRFWPSLLHAIEPHCLSQNVSTNKSNNNQLAQSFSEVKDLVIIKAHFTEVNVSSEVLSSALQPLTHMLP